jgi:RNA-binding protein 39
VRLECKKFGQVRHIAVDVESQGHIYLKFDSIKSAQKAIDALNGRYFAKRQVLLID